VFQHFERLPILDLAYAIRNRRHAVMEIHIASCDVDGLVFLRA
jgi:hypothetical protein